MAEDFVLAIDQGTTSTRAMFVLRQGHSFIGSSGEHSQSYPELGWVEHDPEEIWQNLLLTTRTVIRDEAARIAAIGITNQRETVVVWDRSTGEPIYPAIVWQDRRTAETCDRLKRDGVEAEVRAKTGLLLDPYFSATKIAWILDNVSGARSRADRGELAAGTIDSFLLWRLTGGEVHATDATNASRTLLFDIHRNCWDGDLCRLFGVPEALLPEVHDNSHIFGLTSPGLFERQIPIAGMAGDQQAALFGQACFEPGTVKSTYGTGCFMLLNTGEEAVASEHRLLTTPAYRMKGKTTYALEGSIFIAGAAVRWLRDGIRAIADESHTEEMAAGIADGHGVYMVPAFVGLGAPHWDANAKGAVFGLTLDATGSHLTRAALEATAYQTCDLVEAMIADGCSPPAAIRVDGGMTANNWLCRFLASITGIPVKRSAYRESTALGAAYHAGLATGFWSGMDEIARIQAEGDWFEPAMAPDLKEKLVAGWKDAVSRTLSRPSPSSPARRR